MGSQEHLEGRDRPKRASNSSKRKGREEPLETKRLLRSIPAAKTKKEADFFEARGEGPLRKGKGSDPAREKSLSPEHELREAGPKEHSEGLQSSSQSKMEKERIIEEEKRKEIGKYYSVPSGKRRERRPKAINQIFGGGSRKDSARGQTHK